jgi:hypothetical protein
VELNEIDGACEAKVAKMPRTSVICLATGAADLSVLQNTHSGIKKAPNLGLIALKGGLCHNFHNRSLFNLIGRFDTELDANHRLYIGCGLIESRWHLFNQ